MTKIITFLFALLSICTLAYPMPTETERQDALNLMYMDSTDQELHFYNTSNYESVEPRWINGLVHYSCAYSNFLGKGYVLSVIKSEDGKVWQIQRQYGADQKVINESWTCINCNGESYSFPTINEHGLCE